MYLQINKMKAKLPPVLKQQTVVWGEWR